MAKKTQTEVINYLLEEGDGKDLLVLFDNTKELRNYGKIIANGVRSDVSARMDKTRPFKITDKQIRVGDRKVILGLKSMGEHLTALSAEVVEHD